MMTPSAKPIARDALRAMLLLITARNPFGPPSATSLVHGILVASQSPSVLHGLRPMGDLKLSQAQHHFSANPGRTRRKQGVQRSRSLSGPTYSYHTPIPTALSVRCPDRKGCPWHRLYRWRYTRPSVAPADCHQLGTPERDRWLS